MTQGTILKMEVKLASPVTYVLPVGEAKIPLNPYIGKKIKFVFQNNIICMGCQKKTKTSFNQGYCFKCMNSLAACDMCILKPELCHYDQGTCREPDWGLSHCMQDHFIYLANSSGLKVGITRHTQVPTRWIDQGAVAALPIGRVKNRLQSGLVEAEFKNHFDDTTNWQKMLKGSIEFIDLEEKRDEILNYWPEDIMGEPLTEEKIVTIEYPVLEYPKKVKSLNLDKEPIVEGILMGIKGQYLILDSGVINMRKYQGYEIKWEDNG
jgi:hypothetical protein